ncbi:MFS transporter [Chelonobacter oris]|uniref:MFS transporter n=1 Tax=Chelonobacter oris TaxID=505317 RepID=A0A0A3AL88_9PAST|nr:MFS transporter [Chelonobacter oris]KGQ70091.1 MFS transporter [Chelonobacter oris]
MDLRQAIAGRSMSPFQWGIVMLAFLLNVLDGFDVLALAFTASAIKTDFGLDGAQVGYLLSAGLIGMTIGSLFLAPLADKFGRRPLLLVSVLLSTLGMLLSGFAADHYQLALWRVITGLGVGSILACTNVIVSEYSSRKWHGLAISLYAAGFGIGAVLGGMSARFLQMAYGWQSVFFIGAALTGACFVVILLFLPESIDFLMSKKPKNALQRLNKIAARLNLKGEWTLVQQTKKQQQPRGILELFSPNYLKITLLVWAAFFTIMFSFYFISSWTPALLEQAGMSKNESISVGMMLSLGGTCGALTFGFFASRWTARHILMVFGVLASIAIVGFVFSLQSIGFAFVLGILIGSLINGCISGLYILNPSLYQAEIRSTGVGFSIGIGRFGAIFAPILAGHLLEAGWQSKELYLGAAAVMLISTLAVYGLKPKANIISV